MKVIANHVNILIDIVDKGFKFPKKGGQLQRIPHNIEDDAIQCCKKKILLHINLKKQVILPSNITCINPIKKILKVT